MPVLYVLEHGSTVGIDGGLLTVKKEDNIVEFPKDTIEIA